MLVLNAVQGSLVDDPSVMEMLNVTKNTAQEVQEKLAVSPSNRLLTVRATKACLCSKCHTVGG